MNRDSQVLRLAGPPLTTCSLTAATEAVAALSVMLAGAERDVVLSALVALHGLGPAAQDSLPAVVGLFNHPDADVQRAAVTTAAQVGRQRACELVALLLSSRLTEQHPDVLLMALATLGPQGTEAISFAVQAFNDPRGRVRKLALRALAALQAPAGVLVPIMRRARTDRHAAVRAAARGLSARLVVAA